MSFTATIKGKALRELAQNLGRFADVRETAKYPQDRVVVQAGSGMLKVVAGAYYGTIIASVHATTQQFRAVISARELLTQLKSAKTKSDYKFVDLNLGYEVGCTLVEDDAEVKNFLRLDKKLPQYVLPPTELAHSQGTVLMSADVLDSMGRLLPATTDYYHSKTLKTFPIAVAGKIYTKNDMVRFVGTNTFKFSATQVRGKYDLFGLIYGEWLEASRGIGDSVMEFFDDGTVMLIGERYKTVGSYDMLMNTRYPLDFEKDRLENIEYKVVADRTKLVKSVREQQKFDKHGRVALQYEDNALIVKPFDEAKHGWFVKGDNILSVLANATAKQVGIGLRIGRRQPINVRIPEWQIEVAPVTLEPSSTSK